MLEMNGELPTDTVRLTVDDDVYDVGLAELERAIRMLKLFEGE